MSRQRLFDYDEAVRLKATGLSDIAIGKQFGVSGSAIYFACNPDARAESTRRVSAWQRQGVCVECGGQCSRVGGQPSHRCRECCAKAAATSVRADELRCGTCQTWKPDAEFPHSRSKKVRRRRGRHNECRLCGTVSKRSYRERTRVPCSHGCGTMVNTADRRDKTKPPECYPCALQRIRLDAA